jgi:hypothetical protein
MAERADRIGQAIGELLQAAPRHLVIVAAAGMSATAACSGGRGAPFARLPVGRGVARQVVEPCGHDRERARHELCRPGPLQAVRRHVVHRAVKSVVQPCEQRGFGGGEIDAGDADLGKSELAAPAPQLREQGLAVQDVGFVHCSLRF